IQIRATGATGLADDANETTVLRRDPRALLAIVVAGWNVFRSGREAALLEREAEKVLDVEDDWRTWEVYARSARRIRFVDAQLYRVRVCALRRELGRHALRAVHADGVLRRTNGDLAERHGSTTGQRHRRGRSRSDEKGGAARARAVGHVGRPV